jgi:antitoxin (DNA-binding transcriptional repressor) of toxin-antitoxin stability system
MKTFPLRELVRRPKTVKKLTAAGQTVRITDDGRPLWVIRPADETGDDSRGQGDKEWLETMFEEVLQEKPVAGISAGQIVLDSRR